MFKKVFVVVIILLTASLVWAQIRTSGTTVSEALANREARDVLLAQAKGVGLNCYLVQEYACKKMISRAERNPQLKAALLQTQAKDVSVWPEIWPWFSAGSVGTGSVNVNILVSDEKIIEFLTK